MPVTNTPIFPQAIINTGNVVYHGTGTFILSGGINTATGTFVPIFTPSANGAVITAITAMNLDTATCTVVMLLCTGVNTNFQVLGAAFIAPSGTSTPGAVPPINLLAGTSMGASLPFDSCGNRILYVQAGSTLAVGLLNTIISVGAQVNFAVQGGNF